MNPFSVSLNKADSLLAVVTDLSDLVWGLSTSAKLTFIQELNGLETLVELLKGTEDPVVLGTCLKMIKCLGLSQSGLIDDC
jgi:hypothetical protein